MLENLDHPSVQMAIWTAISAVLVALVTGVFAYLTARTNKQVDAQNDVMERELNFQAASLDFTAYMSEWNEITADILALFRTTKIDRFMILRAWNGTIQPKWTTAFFQLREEGQQPYTYTHLQLDDDYVTRLRDTISRGHMLYKVDAIPESLIRSIYDSEGVRHSLWFHLDTKELKDSPSVGLTYCSFATHEDEDFTDEELLRCRLITSRIKGLAHTMNGTKE